MACEFHAQGTQELTPSAVKVWNPNHWTARELPSTFLSETLKHSCILEDLVYLCQEKFLLGVPCSPPR